MMNYSWSMAGALALEAMVPDRLLEQEQAQPNRAPVFLCMCPHLVWGGPAFVAASGVWGPVAWHWWCLVEGKHPGTKSGQLEGGSCCLIRQGGSQCRLLLQQEDYTPLEEGCWWHQDPDGATHVRWRWDFTEVTNAKNSKTGKTAVSP